MEIKRVSIEEMKEITKQTPYYCQYDGIRGYKYERKAFAVSTTYESRFLVELKQKTDIAHANRHTPNESIEAKPIKEQLEKMGFDMTPEALILQDYYRDETEDKIIDGKEEIMYVDAWLEEERIKAIKEAYQAIKRF